ncbi:MAG: ROK family protein [Ideonella sp.]
MTATRKHSRRQILVIDVGGSHVKCLLSGETSRRKFSSGPGLTPQQMVEGVLEIAADWRYDVVSIGYPGVVRKGAPAVEPHHLASGWVGFDFEAAFRRPVRIVNDAAMQALGSYQGGKMLFLGLGTGLGSALVVDGHILAMELGHLRRSKLHDYEDLLGKSGYKRLGKKKWHRKVFAAVEGFSAALLPDEIVIGGGQADRLKTLPALTRRCSNAAAFVGGFRLWDESTSALSPKTYQDLS